MSKREVFVVVMEAVYKHGVYGPFTSKEDARAAAESLAASGDGP